MKKFFTLAGVLMITACSFAQTQKNSSVISKEDSLEIIRELVADLNTFFETGVGTSVSYGMARVGVGNGYFSPKTTNTTGFNKAYYNASGAYFHKSGLGLTVSGYAIPENSKFNYFQTIVSPSYDYTKSPDVGFGISYSHYFIKDSLSFETSPLTNELYGYVSYRKSKLRPTLGVNYATGVIEETSSTLITTTTTTTTVTDLTLIGSVQYPIKWRNVIGSRDQFVFSPSLMTVAGTNKYGTNIAISALGRNNKHYNNSGKNKELKIKKINTGNGNGNGGSTLPVTITESSSEKTGLELQSFSLILGADYSVGRISFQPQILLDYSIPAIDKKLYALFNATLGVSF